MVEVKKIMEKDAAGIDRQIYPQTVPEAILGLKELIKSSSTGASEAYVRLQCADILRLAQDYTNQQIASLDFSGGGSLDVDKKYVDDQDAVTLAAAKKYADGLSAGVIGNEYTDEEKAKLARLKEYYAGDNIEISSDGKISAINVGGGSGGSDDYQLPTASVSRLGGVKIGERLTINGDGVLSADPQLLYTPGPGIMISNTGVISATNIDIGVTFEKVGEV